MSSPDPSIPQERWQEVLRAATVALKGRGVGVWEADARGRLHLLAGSSMDDIGPVAAEELAATLHELGELSAARRPRPRWVASRLPRRRWCIAPVRSEPPRPPPTGVERRARERMTLELAGVCIGLMGEHDRPAPPPAGDVESRARLAMIVDQVPAVVWTTDARLRVTSRTGAGLNAADILPERVVGASLLDQYYRREVSYASLQAHRRALAGESVSYQMQVDDRCYDAHVKPLLDQVGAIVGVVGLAVDVSDRERALADARRSRRELEDFFENATVGLLWMGPDGTIVRANQAQLVMLGYARDDFVGRSIAQFYDDPADAESLLRRLRVMETLRNVEARLRHRNGSTRLALVSANVVAEGGRFVHARCVVRDITELKQAEQAIAHYRAMVQSADDAIIGKTLDGTITTWNPAATRLYGYAAHEVIGKPISILVPAALRDELPALFESLRRGERVEHYETTRVRKDGLRVDVSLRVSPILDAFGHPIGATAIARDISYRRQAERQLLRGALHDALTDLPNRASFLERVSQALARGRRDESYQFAVLFLDCDNFKVVNDSLGHAAGDRLLMGIARRLQESVRPGDVVARFGGDEFTLLLEDIDGMSDVEPAARRIRDSLAAPFSLEGREVFATASIGIAMSGPDYEEPQDMLRDADLAMYRAKERGPARFQVFDVEMRDWAHARFGMEADLRVALDGNQFRLAFQPIVELETGRVRGFEALLRWHHPDRNVILPLEFVPLAEQTGQIVPIGIWVVREACRSVRSWQEQVPAAGALRISVNLSAKQLGHPRIVEDIRGALEEANLAPSALSLEITESVLMENVEASTAVLHELRGLGVELHMDDFGTGYSSLSYLPRFPLQGIKVDRSFVRRMGARRTDLEIVRSIVDLADKLKLGVIAEGVETAWQRRRLIALGCMLGQGYLFARPLDPEAALNLLSKQAGAGAAG